LQVHIANGQIVSLSSYAMIHPKMCPDGRYPHEFHEPTPLGELRQMSTHHLNELLTTYEILADSGQYRGLHSRRYAADFDPGLSRLSKRVKFLALCDFLGASTLAEIVRTRSATDFQSLRHGRPAMMQRAIAFGGI